MININGNLYKNIDSNNINDFNFIIIILIFMKKFILKMNYVFLGRPFF